MRKKFCPKCGKTTDELYDNLCEDCFLSKVTFVEKLPDKIILKTCKICGKIYIDKDTAASVDIAIDKLLTKLLEKPEIKSATYRIENEKTLVTIKLSVQNLEKEEKKIMTLVKKSITCESCSLKQIGYYQSILQLRGQWIIVNKMLEEVEKQIDVISQFDNYAFISKIENVTNGIDVYIGSKSSAHQIAQQLKSKFKANVKISRKLIGSIRGKKAYRDTMLISVS